MLLYINNASLHIRTVLQLSVSVRNVTGTAATIAVALQMPYFFLSYVLEVSISERRTLRASSFFVADYAYNRSALEAYFHVQVAREISADCSQTTKLSIMIYDAVVDAIVICRFYQVPLS